MDPRLVYVLLRVILFISFHKSSLLSFMVPNEYRWTWSSVRQTCRADYRLTIYTGCGEVREFENKVQFIVMHLSIHRAARRLCPIFQSRTMSSIREAHGTRRVYRYCDHCR